LKSVIIDELKTLQIIDERKMAKINNSLIKWSGNTGRKINNFFPNAPRSGENGKNPMKD
jgi:hypothetical protein